MINFQELTDDVLKLIKASPLLIWLLVCTAVVAVANGVLSVYRGNVAHQCIEAKNKASAMQKVVQRAPAIQQAAELIGNIHEASEGRLFKFSQNVHVTAWFFEMEAKSGVKIDNPVRGQVVNLSKNSEVVDLNNFKPTADELYKITYSVQVRGEYGAILQFLHNVNYDRLLATIESVALTSGIIKHSFSQAADDKEYQEQVASYESYKVVQANIKMHLIGQFQ